MAAGGVILLHGLARTSRSMAPMARALRRAGFDVLNLDHPTRQSGIAALADHFEAASAPWRARRDGPIHIVGHSLGGLVARAWIARQRPERFGRAVLLGTPNKGSEIADVLADWAPYRRAFGPVGGELTTSHPSREALLAPIDERFGLIAGSRSFGMAPHAQPNDGKVSVASALAAGRACLTLPVNHTLMMQDAAVIAATSRFLRQGAF